MCLQLHAPCLLFFDEIDAIAPKKDSNSRMMEQRIASEIASCMTSECRTSTRAGMQVFCITHRDSLFKAPRTVFSIFFGISDKILRSGQAIVLQARPTMDAAVMSCHLSLSATSSSSLTRFRPVVMAYRQSSSFQILLFIVHRPTVALGVQQVAFLLAFNYELWMATSPCSF